jgi:hypothetical protein
MEVLMKKLLLVLVISALLVPAAAYAVQFKNLSGVVKGRATIKVTQFSNVTTGTLTRTTTVLSGGTDHAIATLSSSASNVLDFEDHILFNQLGIVVTGRLLNVGKHKVAGPASFTIKMPATGAAGDKVTLITGAANVTGVTNAKETKAVVNMTFQPESVGFGIYSSNGVDVLNTVTGGDAKIHLPAMRKAFSNRSTVNLPDGF